MRCVENVTHVILSCFWNSTIELRSFVKWSHDYELNGLDEPTLNIRHDHRDKSLLDIHMGCFLLLLAVFYRRIALAGLPGLRLSLPHSDYLSVKR